MAAQLCAAILIAGDVDLSLYVPTAALAAVMVWHYFGVPALTGLGVLYVCRRMIRRLQPPALIMEGPVSIASASIGTTNREILPPFQTIWRLFSLSLRESSPVGYCTAANSGAPPACSGQSEPS
jgi:hypothetical protein